MTTLDEFQKQYPISPNMRWRNAARSQMRDWKVLAADLEFASDAEFKTGVVSAHTSKSIDLPVVQYTIPDLGLTLTLRDNFHNVKLSVKSDRPLTLDDKALELSAPNTPISSAYFEGFPGNVYGSYSENRAQFSVELKYGEEKAFSNVTAFTTAIIESAKKAKEIEDLKSPGRRGERNPSGSSPSL